MAISVIAIGLFGMTLNAGAASAATPKPVDQSAFSYSKITVTVTPQAGVMAPGSHVASAPNQRSSPLIAYDHGWNSVGVGGYCWTITISHTAYSSSGWKLWTASIVSHNFCPDGAHVGDAVWAEKYNVHGYGPWGYSGDDGMQIGWLTLTFQ